MSDNLNPYISLKVRESLKQRSSLPLLQDIEDHKLYHINFSTSGLCCAFLRVHFVPVLGIRTMKFHISDQCTIQLCYNRSNPRAFQTLVTGGDSTWMIGQEEWTEMMLYKKRLEGLLKRKGHFRKCHVLKIAGVCFNRRDDQENTERDFELVCRDPKTLMPKFTLIDADESFAFLEILDVVDIFKLSYPLLVNKLECASIVFDRFQ